MKIGINATYAATQFLTGVGNYTYNLIKHILTLDTKNYYTLYYKYKINKKDFLPFQVKTKHFEPSFSWLSLDKLDVFHDPTSKFVRIGHCKSVVTVHDIVVALKEDYTSEKFKRAQMPKLLKTIKKANHIISVSQFTKQELMAKFNVPENKISVVHHGIDTEIFNSSINGQAILAKYKIHGKYLLFVGNIEQRKNIIGLVDVFEKVTRKHQDLYLVLIGRNGYKGEEIRNYIGQSRVREKIIMINYIHKEELPAFYRQAQVLLFPSFYEGFGFPILEAMACDCPVITSNTASMPEVGEDAVLYVNPFDTDSVVTQILQLLENKSLREELIEKGREQVKKFTWEKTAQNTIKVYESLL